ncbi:MAG: SurA N-terminal domain-containing protein [Acidobacteriota bacterium]|nr:SurA N-terminal domain-containing protein [Acidobacteriota bacterium]
MLVATIGGCHRSPGPDVMATVNGKNIMQADVERLYKANLGDTPEEPTPEQARIMKLKVLQQMIQDEIIQQQAAKLHLAASDEDVNARLTDMKAPFTQEEWDKQLKQRNLTVDDLKRDIRRSLTYEKLMNKEIESKINISDTDIADYYNAHKADYNFIQPQYHLAEIVVTPSPSQTTGNLQNSKASSEADARKKIQILYNRLRSGEDFGAVAMNFSENPNDASNGGDMGFVGESVLRSQPDVFNAISKLKPGDITDIIPVYDSTGTSKRLKGFVIYKLFSREPAGQRELKDPRVQQSIRQYLRQSHAQLLKNAYFEVLQNQAKIRNYYAEQILKDGGK